MEKSKPIKLTSIVFHYADGKQRVLKPVAYKLDISVIHDLRHDFKAQSFTIVK